LNPYQIKNKIESILDSISPVNTNLSAITIDAILEFIFIFLFVVIFKPYVINELSSNSVVQVALTTALIFSFFSWLYYVVFYRTININQWTYKKDIIRYLKTLIITASIFMCYAYYALIFIYASEIKTSIANFFTVGILYISAIGVIFYFFLKFTTYLSLQMQLIQEANNATQKVKPTSFVFCGKNNGEVVKATLENLIYIQSMGHYLNFFLKNKENNVEVLVIRNSINEVKNRIANCKSMFQCHRSFIVNKKMIISIEGNSQKAFLTFANTKNKVPISRENYKLIKNTYALRENKQSFNENNHLKAI